MRRRTRLALVLALAALAACGHGGGVTKDQADASLCLHIGSAGRALFPEIAGGGPLRTATVAALRADAHLLDEAGDADRSDSVDAVADAIEGLPSGIQARVFLRDGISGADLAALGSTLGAVPGLRVLGYESKEQAFERFKRIFRNQPDLIRNASPDALPASFGVLLTSGSVDELRSRLAGEPAVENVGAAGFEDSLPEDVATKVIGLVAGCHEFVAGTTP